MEELSPQECQYWVLEGPVAVQGPKWRREQGESQREQTRLFWDTYKGSSLTIKGAPSQRGHSCPQALSLLCCSLHSQRPHRDPQAQT